MNNHVTNLELSKKLKEIGVQQDSEFYWIDFSQGTKENGAWSLESSTEGYNVGTYFSAFLSTELGEMLPEFCTVFKASSTHTDKFVCHLNTHGKKDFGAKTEQDARAKCLIWLIENNLII